VIRNNGVQVQPSNLEASAFAIPAFVGDEPEYEPPNV
jgi:hypothetical protein